MKKYAVEYFFVLTFVFFQAEVQLKSWGGEEPAPIVGVAGVEGQGTTRARYAAYTV